MTDELDSIERRRSLFIDAVRENLTSRRGQYRGAQLANAGRHTGALNPAEFRALDKTNRLPEWVIAGIRTTESAAIRDLSPIYTLHGGEIIDRRNPILGLGTKAPPAFAGGMRKTPDVDVYELSHADIYVHNFVQVVASPDGVIRQLSDNGAEDLWPIVQPIEPVMLHGKTLVLVVEGSAVLSHWLYDTLPRMHVAGLAGHPLSSFDHILVAAAHAGYHRESLALLGLHDDKIVTRMARGVRYALDEAVFVSPVRERFIGGNWLYDYARDLFVGTSSASGPEKIFLSRSKASRRRIVNEAALQEIAIGMGYTVVYAEDYSVRQFASLLAGAKRFIGPHGAGHANIAFMKGPGGAVAELFGMHISTEYWSMSATFGFDYFLLEQDPIETSRTISAEISIPFLEKNGMDFSVAGDRFANLLRRMETT